MIRAALFLSSSWRKAAVVLVFAGPAFASPAPAAAQTAAGAAPETVPATVPDVVIVAPKLRHACEGGGDDTAPQIDYTCLNQTLQLQAQGAPPAGQATPGGDLTSPEYTGTFGYSATRQRMGNHFGTSATPQRPPAPVYAPPPAVAVRPSA